MFALATGVLTLAFDRLLTVGPLAVANWTAIAGPNQWVATSIGVEAGSPSAVTGTFVISAASPPGATVTYAPPPFDLLGATGTPAAAFTNFPITVF